MKYDLETKMWLYLHKDRTVKWEGWKELLEKEDPAQSVSAAKQ